MRKIFLMLRCFAYSSAIIASAIFWFYLVTEFKHSIVLTENILWLRLLEIVMLSIAIPMLFYEVWRNLIKG